MSTRLENTSGNSSKFWEISVSGSSTTVRYGKIGANGTTQTKDHGTAAKAKKFAETQIAKKQKGGYVAVDDNKRARDSESEESSSNSASASSEESQARKKSKGAEAVIPVKWVVPCGSADDGSSAALGIYVDNKFAFAGNEEGAVIKTNHQGKILAKFQLPSGVKAIVGDGEFLYAGTNEGSLFDLTNGVPREMCKIEDFTEFLWIDVYDGMVGCADDSGNLALINGEGEIVWQKSDENWGSGWCVRMDASGVYHGHNTGVHKYDYKGKQLWFNDTVNGVMFGVHTDKHLFVTGYGSGEGSCQIDKKSGKTVRTFAASGSSCAVDAKGTLFVVEEQGFDVKTGKRVWSFDHAECNADSLNGNDILRSPSAAILGTKLFTIGGHEDCLALIDVSKRTITQALAGKTTKPKFIKPDKSVKTVQVSNDVATTADESKGIKVKCVKEGSKIRVRVVTAGYKSDWNVQFPRALRKAGAEFMVDSIVTSTNGGFYRAVGDIKKLK